MRKTASLLLVAFLLFGGIDLIFDTSGPDTNQTVKILAGAMCISIGLVYGWLLLEKWFKWRKLLKQIKANSSR